jgi:hypothetical protein
MKVQEKHIRLMANNEFRVTTSNHNGEIINRNINKRKSIKILVRPSTVPTSYTTRSEISNI